MIALVLVACSSTSSPPADAAGYDGPGSDLSGSDASAQDASSSDAASHPYPIYASTNTTLFRLDSPASTPVMVGAFDCIGGAGQDTSMTDLALDANQGLWGVSPHYVYGLVVSGATVHCATMVSLPTPGPVFYGLSLAPAGVLDPTKEVLVAADTSGALWSVDATGSIAQHGTLGIVPANDGHGHVYANAGKAWELSGDIVMLANGGSPVGYATVRDCPSPPSSAGCNPVDTLVALDLTQVALAGTQSVVASVRGQVVKAPACSDPSATGYGSFYGIAASGGSVIGFSHAGVVVQISEADGTGCVLSSTPGDLWGGAGVSTLAPP